MKEEQVINGTIQGINESSGKVKMLVQKVVMSRSRRRDQRMGSMAQYQQHGNARKASTGMESLLVRAVSPLANLTDN